jgi:hypothetical protein
MGDERQRHQRGDRPEPNVLEPNVLEPDLLEPGPQPTLAHHRDHPGPFPLGPVQHRTSRPKATRLNTPYLRQWRALA